MTQSSSAPPAKGPTRPPTGRDTKPQTQGPVASPDELEPRRSGPRDAMLSAAARLFRKRGYEGVGVAELLEESGLPRGSLYFHFPGGKEQIAVEMMARAQASVAANVAEVAARSTDVSGFVAAVFEAWAASMQSADYVRGCGVGIITLEMASVSPALRAEAEAVFAAWESQLADLLVGLDMPVERAGRMAGAMLGAIQGAIVMAKAKRTTAPFDLAAEAMVALSRSWA